MPHPPDEPDRRKHGGSNLYGPRVRTNFDFCSFPLFSAISILKKAIHKEIRVALLSNRGMAKKICCIYLRSLRTIAFCICRVSAFMQTLSAEELRISDFKHAA